MKAIHMTTLAMLTAVLGFAASVAWAQETGAELPALRVAESVICACIGQGHLG